MTLDVNADGDFAAVVDRFEQVKVVRRGGGSVAAQARRVSEVVFLSEGMGAGLGASDIVWDLVWPAGEQPVSLGDKVVGVAGACGVVLRVECLGPGARLRCKTRDLRLCYALSSLVEIQRALWDDLGSGPEIVGWETFHGGVPARMQPMEVDVDHQSAPPSSTSRFVIHLDIDFNLNHENQIVGPSGEVYRVDRFAASERFDSLPFVEATLTEAP